MSTYIQDVQNLLGYDLSPEESEFAQDEENAGSTPGECAEMLAILCSETIAAANRLTREARIETTGGLS